jgi:anti-sigma factor RsiW
MTPPDCRARLEQLFAYLDGELTAADCRRIERHFADCGCCGNLAAGLRQAMAACQAAGQQALPAGVRRRARRRVKEWLAEKDLTGG